MHVVVAGASGATGRRVVDVALAAGHRVTALVRAGAHLDVPRSVDVGVAEVAADQGLTLPDDADVVISALGMRPDHPETPVCAPGTANLVAAMARAGIPRIVVVSAVPAYSSGPGEPWWFRLLRSQVRRGMPRVYDDLEEMEAVLRRADASCAWTIVRPGYLTDGEPTSYCLLPERNATTGAHRADLAHALVALAGDDAAVGRAYGLRRGRAARTRSAA